MNPQAPSDEIDDLDFEPAGTLCVLDREAAAWVVRLSSGEASAEDRAAFTRWCALSEEHRAALERLRGLWAGLGELLPAPRSSALPRARPAPAAARAPRWRRGLRSRWALAASLLLAVALGWALLAPRHDEVTGVGERRYVALAEGSRLTLDAETRLDVRLGPQRREIELLSGQAYFDVAADAARPFVVIAGDSRIQVLGTRFSVRRDGPRVHVAVEQGRVWAGGAGGPGVTLVAGEGTVIERGVAPATNPIEPETELAWREGRLVVDNLTLDEIVARLDPHYRGTLLVAGTGVAQRRFDAVIALDRIDDWLAGLEATAQLRVARVGTLTVLY